MIMNLYKLIACLSLAMATSAVAQTFGRTACLSGQSQLWGIEVQSKFRLLFLFDA